MLVEETASGTVNLAKLLAGSEGTLAFITEAVVETIPRPETKSIGLLSYRSLQDAMRDVAPILDHEPAAVEVMDDVLLDLARETAEFSGLVEQLPNGTESLLLVEFYADCDAAGRRKVTDLLEFQLVDVEGDTNESPLDGKRSDERVAIGALEAHDIKRREKFWKVRKSGLPILLSRTSDEKHISFIEDSAVPPCRLPEYVEEIENIPKEHDTFASYYAHAGPGVLHIRPLVSTKSIDGVEEMVSIADAITDLVVEFGGSVSGEHGDGRARTQWNRKLYGDQLWERFGSLKSAFDPSGCSIPETSSATMI